MPLIINGPALREAVLADGQPREAEDSDGNVLMLYRDGDLVRSVLLADWPATEAALTARTTDRARLQSAVRTRLDSAVGVRVDDLLVGQLKALLAFLLWERGALDADLKVKPLDQWGRR